MSAAPDRFSPTEPGATYEGAASGPDRGQETNGPGHLKAWYRRLRETLAVLAGTKVSGGGASDGGLGARLFSYQALATLISATALVALLAIPEVPRILCPLGALFGLPYYYLASRRDRLRQRLLRKPFPEAYREVLRSRVPFYWTLSENERTRFEGEVAVFLAEQRIYELAELAELAELTKPTKPTGLPLRLTDAGPATVLSDGARQGGAPSLADHHVLIAASAATLVLGRPEWRLPTVRDVVIYPGAFTEETYEQGPMAHTVGMVHSQGPILFSLPALLRAYPSRSAPDAGGSSEPITENVGLHEFAHVLDFAFSDNHAGGVPGNLSADGQRRWARQMNVERERLERGDSVLHPYGLKSDAELFAVAVESFFTDPLRVRTEHPELYQLFSDFFNQDPASRLLPVLPSQAAWQWSIGNWGLGLGGKKTRFVA